MAFNPKDFLKKSSSKPVDPDPKIGFDDSLPQTDSDSDTQTGTDPEPNSETKPPKQSKPTAKTPTESHDPKSPEPPPETDSPSIDPPPSTDSPEPPSDDPDANKPPSTDPSSKPSQASSLSDLPQAQRVEFATVPIRMIKVNDTWYFVLTDFLYILKIPSNVKYFKALSTKPELADKWDKLTRQITFIDNDTEVTELCADKDGILTIITHMEEKFPGPFTRWLDHVSQLPSVQLSPPPPPPPQQPLTT